MERKPDHRDGKRSGLLVRQAPNSYYPVCSLLKIHVCVTRYNKILHRKTPGVKHGIASRIKSDMLARCSNSPGKVGKMEEIFCSLKLYK